MAAAGILAILAAIVWLNGASNRSPIGDTVTLTRVIQDGEKTIRASLSVPYVKNTDDYRYLNAAVDFNIDGKFAPYPLHGKTQDEWMVRNMSARVLAKEGNSFGFPLRDYAADDRRNFPVVVMLTKSPVTAWAGESIGRSATRALRVEQIVTDDVSSRMRLDPTGQGDTGSTSGFAAPPDITEDELPHQPPGEGAGAGGGGGGVPGAPAVENLKPPPADFDVFHANVPDITQGENECVPTSTANSLLWLAEQYRFQEKLPASAAAIIAELKEDMKWRAESGVTTDTNFLPGKEAFVKRHGLPLVTHRITERQFDLNIMTKIAEELQKGQDVEVVLEYGQYDAQGRYTRKGGHMVTAVGARRTGNNSFLDIHDPASPGPETLDIYKIDGTRVIDYRYQGPYVTYIRTALAESPIEQPAAAVPAIMPPSPSPTLLPSPSTTPVSQSGNSTTTVTKTLRPKTYSPSDYYDATHVSMKVLVLDGKKYPLFQFYGYNDPSDCAAPHYHSAMVGVPAYSLEYEPKTDPDSTGCGFGEIAKLSVDRVILDSDEFHTIYEKIQRLRLGNS